MDQAPQKTAAELSVVSDAISIWIKRLKKTAAEFSSASDAISIWIKRLKKPQRNFLPPLMPSAYGSSASKNRSGIICCF